MCTPYIECQKWLPWQRSLEPRSRQFLRRLAWPRKSTPRIKQRLASYLTTKVIAHKASYSKLRPKIGCHGNVPQHHSTPSYTWFLVPIWVQNPNGISIGLAVFAQITAECLYTLQYDGPFPLKIASSHWGNLDAHLIMVPWAHPSPQPKRHHDWYNRFCRAY